MAEFSAVSCSWIITIYVSKLEKMAVPLMFEANSLYSATVRRRYFHYSPFLDTKRKVPSGSAGCWGNGAEKQVSNRVAEAVTIGLRQWDIRRQ